jgi:hypothetical protein
MESSFEKSLVSIRNCKKGQAEQLSEQNSPISEAGKRVEPERASRRNRSA